jgi:cathepsin D
VSYISGGELKKGSPRSLVRSHAFLALLHCSEFYATISVGTPAVDYYMVLDTGSSDMILAEESCSGCSSSTPGYSPSSSSTSVTSSEAFSITYGSGSASGTLVEDTVGIAGYSMP